MFLIQIYRYLRNYITITVSGGFGERFLNLCNKENVYLWNTVFDKGKITTNIFCSDFIKLISIKRRSGVNIKIINKHGLAFFIKNYKSRKILSYGLISGLIFCIIMNQFVWSVEVKAPDDIDKIEIIETVKSFGLYNGILAGTFDEKDISRQVTNTFNGKLLWMAINIKGSKAVIEVRGYNENKTYEISNDNPCNIIANFDGQIISTEIKSGTKTTENGSAVKKGDILVSGININDDGTVSYMHSDAKITALNTAELTKHYKKNETYFCIDESNTSYYLKFFNITIPCSLKFRVDSKEKLTYNKSLEFNGMSLPVGFCKSTFFKPSESKKNINELLFFADDFTNEEYNFFKNTLITNVDYTINRPKDTFVINGNYKCVSFIGKKSYIKTEN